MSSSKVASPPPANVGPDDVRRTLEKILASRHFVNAHKKKAFLRLVCEFYLDGKAQDLNEYRLAFDVFGRDASYHPSSDPIVRVVAHDIRKKLELYYQSEGALDDVRLELPSGSYQPIFARQAVAAPEEPDDAPEAEPALAPAAEAPPSAAAAAAARRVAPAAVALLVAVAVVAAVAVTLALSARGVAGDRAAAPAGLFWAPFLGDDRPTLVVLSNPPVLRLANASDPPALTKNSVPLPPETLDEMRTKFVINPEIVVREQGGQDDHGVIKQTTTPRLIYSRSVYTGVGEAIALYHLTGFFGGADRQVLLKQSRTLSAEDLKDHNVILLGGVWANEWVGKLAGPEDFVFTGSGTVENRAPRPGEEAAYIPQFDGPTGNLLVDYAVITVRPSLAGGNKVMTLAGVYSQGTEAAAEFITGRSYRAQLDERLRQAAGPDGPPAAFQVLLKVGVENGIPTTIAILGLHGLGE